ncbi:hypothetical protein CC80DRAFT_508989 [Byssothecium circinans]|uniref:F-box domain-containing protein n=1 Tax=Byssothecium circinans TaxID=147558 RepID=A0A6A5TEZ0_9PLEO|nr:hypothetical protein CC80DRAFT_508989 [Byssothecium circinans]
MNTLQSGELAFSSPGASNGKSSSTQHVNGNDPAALPEKTSVENVPNELLLDVFEQPAFDTRKTLCYVSKRFCLLAQPTLFSSPQLNHPSLTENPAATQGNAVELLLRALVDVSSLARKMKSIRIVASRDFITMNPSEIASVNPRQIWSGIGCRKKPAKVAIIPLVRRAGVLIDRLSNLQELSLSVPPRISRIRFEDLINVGDHPFTKIPGLDTLKCLGLDSMRVEW